MRRFLMGKTMTENFRPLTDEDINRLDELLATSSSGDDTFDVSMLDGFLSAIALLNPPLKEESEWYPYIFNEEGTDCEVDEPETVKRLVTQRLQEIRAFQAQRQFYNPIIFPLEDENGEPVTGADGIAALEPWAMGFYNALAQYSDRVDVTEAIEAQLCRIHRFLELDESDPDYEQNMAIRAAVEKEHPVRNLEEGMLEMMKGVIEIARLNLPNKPVSRTTPKVGRNDPCPCGSGKKYKHCHGAIA